MKLDTAAVRTCLKSFDFDTLFREHLGWDKHQASLAVTVDGQTFNLSAVAEKRGLVAYACELLPDRHLRLKIDHRVQKSSKEHFVIYCDEAAGRQVWHWVRREPGKPLAGRDHPFDTSQSGERLIQRLEQIAVSLDEEDSFTLLDATAAARAAFDVDRVTKRFYAGISDLPAPDGPFIHLKAAQRTKRLFVTASSRFRGRQLSAGGRASH